MLVSIRSLLEWKLLDHAVDVMELGEIDSLFAVESVSGRPAVDGGSFRDQGDAVEFEFARG
jgi:hypothetical protein